MILPMLIQGYFYMSVLVVFLYVAVKNNVKLGFIPLDDKNDINPVLSLNIERLLAISMGVSIFVCGTFAFFSLLPTTQTTMLLP